MMGFKKVYNCPVCGGYVESSFENTKCIKCKATEFKNDPDRKPSQFTEKKYS